MRSAEEVKLFLDVFSPGENQPVSLAAAAAAAGVPVYSLAAASLLLLLLSERFHFRLMSPLLSRSSQFSHSERRAFAGTKLCPAQTNPRTGTLWDDIIESLIISLWKRGTFCDAPAELWERRKRALIFLSRVEKRFFSFPRRRRWNAIYKKCARVQKGKEIFLISS